MTILDKEVWVRLGNNVGYYKDLGYPIPQEGKIKGKKILVKVKDLQKGSGILIKYRCDYCSGENQKEDEDHFKKYYKLIKGRSSNNKDCCRNAICMNKKSMESRKIKPIKEGNSLAEKFPELVKEWSKQNDKNAFHYSYGSAEIIWWNCLKCKSEYDMPIYVKVSGCSCPYCTGRRVNQTNCLWTTHPETAKLLKDSKRGYEITGGDFNKKEEFVCKDCNYVESKFVRNVVMRGFQCPICSDGISYPEKFMLNAFIQLNLKIERQKTFEWSRNIKNKNVNLCGNKIYDFYIPSLNCIIETHGEQHYLDKTNPFGMTLEEQQENDKIKEILAIKNNIKYFIIDCSKSDPDYIKNNIITNPLSDLINLENIDWNKCHNFSVSSLIKQSCELWNDTGNIKKISEKLNLNRSTIRRYLKQGSKVGLCNYNANEEALKTLHKNLKANHENRQVRIIQLSRDCKFIKEWDSAAKAKKELDINNIAAVCRGKQYTAGGFKWMYAHEFYKENNGNN